MRNTSLAACALAAAGCSALLGIDVPPITAGMVDASQPADSAPGTPDSAPGTPDASTIDAFTADSAPALSITDVSPPGRTGVSPVVTFTITFSRPVMASTVTTSSIYVTGAGTSTGVVTVVDATHATWAAMPKLAANSMFTFNVSTAVKDTSGASLGAPYSFTFVTGEWSAPAELAQSVFAHRLLADPDGNVMQTWTLLGPAGNARRWTPSAGWSAGGATPIGFSDVGVAAGGNAIGVGGTGTTTSHGQASFFSVGSGWSAVQQVDTEVAPAYVSSISAGMDSSANVMAVFSSYTSGGPYGIKARLHTPGGGWSATITPLANGSGYAFGTHLAMAPNGTAAAVWTQYDAGTAGASSFWAARYTPGGGWAAARQFNTGNVYDGDVAVDSAGNVLVVWNNRSPYIVYFSRNTGSAWSTPSPISVGSSNNANNPVLAMTGAGDAVAVWNQYDGAGSYPLWGAHFSASNGTWGAPLQIGPNAISPARGNAAMDSAGNALVVWENLNTPVHVWASRLPAGAGAWTSAVQLDTLGVAGDADYSMAAACTPTGPCFGAWTQYDTSPRMGTQRLYVATRP